MGGSLDQTEINDIKNKDHYKDIQTFIETGTYKCETTFLASRNFDNVITMEIYEPLYKDAIMLANEQNITNVSFLLGDSSQLLLNLKDDVKKGCVFFLDAHVSGHDSGYNPHLLVPLMNELKIILPMIKEPSVFILDDVRFWKGEHHQASDWIEVSCTNIINLFDEYNIKIREHYVKNDRFWIFTE